MLAAQKTKLTVPSLCLVQHVVHIACVHEPRLEVNLPVLPGSAAYVHSLDCHILFIVHYC